MADEIVIRIEGDDDDDDELDRLAKFEREAEAIDNPGFQPQITMESLFGSDPWWLDPEFINNTVGTQERISYPTAPSQEVESDENSGDYVYVPFFERAITILEGIRGAQFNREPGVSKDEGPSAGFNQSLVNQLGNQIGNAVNAINAAQALNNPIAAGTGAIQTLGNTAGNITNAALTASLGAALAPVLGPFAPVIASIIGNVAGDSIKMFFGTIAEGIQGFFDYASRQSNELAPFSPEIISAQVDRSLSMLDFRMNAGQNFGQQFADIYSAQSDLLLELEKFKLELFTRFQPYAESAVNTLVDIVAVIRNIVAAADFTVIQSLIEVIGTVASAATGPLSLILGDLGRSLSEIAKAERRKRELDQQLQQVAVGRETLQFFGWQP